MIDILYFKRSNEVGAEKKRSRRCAAMLYTLHKLGPMLHKTRIINYHLEKCPQAKTPVCDNQATGVPILNTPSTASSLDLSRLPNPSRLSYFHRDAHYLSRVRQQLPSPNSSFTYPQPPCSPLSKIPGKQPHNC